MRISSIKTGIFQAPAPTGAESQMSEAGHCYLLGLQTDEGISSWGEAHIRSIEHLAEAAELFGTALEGADPLDRGVLWERLVAALGEAKVPLGEYMGALSAADLALWDLAGQACGLPVFRLLGGAHFPRLDTYLMSPEQLLTAPDLLQWAQTLPDRGIGGIGLEIGAPTPENLQLVRDIHQQIGSQRRLIVRLTEPCPDIDSAQQVAKSLEKAEVFWAENLLADGRWPEYAQLHQTRDLPLAAGGSLWGIRQFHHLAESGAVDVIVADLTWCGGLTAAMKIADLARLGGMRIAFRAGRCPLTTLATAHLSAAVPISLPIGLPASFATASGDFFTFAGQLENGFLKLAEQPGWGARLSTELVRRYEISESE